MYVDTTEGRVSEWIKNLDTGGKGTQIFKLVPARAAGMGVRVCNIIEGLQGKRRNPERTS